MHERKNDAAPVALLWTGGWDSTYRLLQLLLVERRGLVVLLVEIRRQERKVIVEPLLIVRSRIAVTGIPTAADRPERHRTDGPHPHDGVRN